MVPVLLDLFRHLRTLRGSDGGLLSVIVATIISSVTRSRGLEANIIFVGAMVQTKIIALVKPIVGKFIFS